MSIIEFSEVTKKYGRNLGIDDVSFSISKGDCVIFHGSNGSGKTTTIRLILGFLRIKRHDEGKIIVNSTKLCYLPEKIVLPEMVKARDFLYDLCHLSKSQYDPNWFEFFSLEKKKSIGKMSKGMKQKLGLIQMAAIDADILLFDEPLSGLDEANQAKAIEMILGLKKKGKTIIISTHYVSLFKEISNRIFRFENHHLYEENITSN